MKNRILLSIIFIFSLIKLNGQKYEFLGVLMLNGDKTQAISYKIAFDIDNKTNEILGYSLSDVGGSHETKNIIKGFYDKKNKKLSFFEKDIVYTKSPISANSFCYVNYTGRVKPNKKRSKISGDFKGWYENKEKCIDGTITMLGSNLVDNIVNKISKKIAKSKKIDDATKDKYDVKEILDSLNTQRLITKENLNVFTNEEEITFTIWDLGEEDGDIINLYHNDNQILKNFEVKKKKHSFKVAISGKNHVFRIEAVNVGELKPNTAMVYLHDGKKNIDFLSNLDIGEQSTITIVRK